MNKKRLGIFLGSIALLIVCSFAAYQYWLCSYTYTYYQRNPWQ